MPWVAELHACMEGHARHGLRNCMHAWRDMHATGCGTACMHGGTCTPRAAELHACMEGHACHGLRNCMQGGSDMHACMHAGREGVLTQTTRGAWSVVTRSAHTRSLTCPAHTRTLSANTLSSHAFSSHSQRSQAHTPPCAAGSNSPRDESGIIRGVRSDPSCRVGLGCNRSAAEVQR